MKAIAFKGLEKKIKKLPTFTWHIQKKKISHRVFTNTVTLYIIINIKNIVKLRNIVNKIKKQMKKEKNMIKQELRTLGAVYIYIYI